MRKLVMLLMVLFFVTQEGCKEKTTEPDPTPLPPEINELFDVAYVASESFEDKAMTTAIGHQKPVRAIKDLIGTRHIIYDGPEKPSDLFPTPPVYYNYDYENGGYIMVPNVIPARWLTNGTFTAVPQPYDVYVVLRDLEAIKYEGYFAVGIGMRNKSDHLELKIDNAETGQTKQVDFAQDAGVPKWNKMSIIRIRYEGANSKVWINNQQLPGTVDVGNGPINRLGYGTNSHAAQHDFFGMWIKFGTLTDAEHEFVYKTLEEQYEPDTYPDRPFANNIRAVWNNTAKAWTAQYEYISPNGVAEDKTKTEYQWYVHDLSVDLNFTHPVAGANKATFVRADYPAEFPLAGEGSPSTGKGARVYVTVKVFDTEGKSWDHFLRSQYTVDNVK